MKKRNEALRTLFELFAGIVLWAILWQIVGVFAVRNLLVCSVGLWVGAALAAGSAWHMYYTLDRALDLNEKDAGGFATGRNMLRYGVIVVVMGGLMVTGWGDPLCAFLGLMGLKAAAFMQPFVHKIILKKGR